MHPHFFRMVHQHDLASDWIYLLPSTKVEPVDVTKCAPTGRKTAIFVLAIYKIHMIQKVLLLHSNNLKGLSVVGFFHHRKPITRNVHCSTCLPLFDLGESSVVPEEGVPHHEELMVKDIIDPSKMAFAVQVRWPLSHPTCTCTPYLQQRHGYRSCRSTTDVHRTCHCDVA